MDISTMLHRVDQLLRAKGLSKAEFYDMVPISSSAVAQWNMGRTKPSPPKIKRMAEILDVDPSYLGLGDIEDEKKEPAAREGNKLDVLDLSDLTPENRAKVRDYFDLVARSQDK